MRKVVRSIYPTALNPIRDSRQLRRSLFGSGDARVGEGSVLPTPTLQLSLSPSPSSHLKHTKTTDIHPQHHKMPNPSPTKPLGNPRGVSPVQSSLTASIAARTHARTHPTN